MNEGISTIVLDKVLLYFRKKLACTSLLRDPEIYYTFAHYCDELEIIVRGYVLGNKQKPIEFKMPRSPWQLWKQKYAPSWLVKKFPIMYETFVINCNVIYPHLKVNVPKDSGAHVILYQMQEPRFTSDFWKQSDVS